jgi:CheY-like chemotaxis protein
VIDLEGHNLVVVEVGHTDTESTTCLHVPSVGLVVAGDVAYNDVHLYLAESNAQTRCEWIAALDKIESLNPRAVIAGHKRPGNDDRPKIIEETRQYIRDFDRVAGTTTPVLGPRGAETILLVEDEDAVRALARDILQEKGYTVLEAARGIEAVLVSAQHPGPIDLLLTDVVMPEMSGRVLADRLALARSGIKVLYMSGYTDNAVVHHGVLDAGTAYLQKPFTPDSLARKVRDILDGGIPLHPVR